MNLSANDYGYNLGIFSQISENTTIKKIEYLKMISSHEEKKLIL